jgi:AcrR family transcriptional regulator
VARKRTARSRKEKPKRRTPAAAPEPRDDGAPRRGRPPISPDVQRARLLEAARKALQKGYYSSVRISDVVRSAGMSSRTFYEHFATKEDVLIELMKQAGQRLVEELDTIMRTTEGDERIERFLNAYLRVCTSMPFDIDSLGDGLTSRVQQTLREGVRDAALHVAEAIARVWDPKAPSPPPEPAAIEVILLGLLGLASRYVHERRVGELAVVRPALRGLLQHLWSMEQASAPNIPKTG